MTIGMLPTSNAQWKRAAGRPGACASIWRTMAVALGSAIMAGSLMPSAWAQGDSAARPSLDAAGRQPTAATRVYLFVDREGNATFSDHAQPGAPAQQIRTYEFAGDTQAQERARAEREYWRARSDAFAQRQQARERDLERAAAIAARNRTERTPAWADMPVRRYFTVPAPVAQGWGTPRGAPSTGGSGSTYQGGPGAASRAGAAFIGSGFAGAR